MTCKSDLQNLSTSYNGTINQIIHLFSQVENLGGKKQTRGRKFLIKTLVMVSGIVIILLLPSAIFYYNESGWTYLDCVYFALVSLTTGGLGNLTNSHNSGKAQVGGNWRWLYQGFTLLWFILGLGFISMVNSLATETIRRASLKHVNSGRRMNPTVKGEEEMGVQRKSAITRRRSQSDSDVLIFESETASITRRHTQTYLF